MKAVCWPIWDSRKSRTRTSMQATMNTLSPFPHLQGLDKKLPLAHLAGPNVHEANPALHRPPLWEQPLIKRREAAKGLHLLRRGGTSRAPAESPRNLRWARNASMASRLPVLRFAPRTDLANSLLAAANLIFSACARGAKPTYTPYAKNAALCSLVFAAPHTQAPRASHCGP